MSGISVRHVDFPGDWEALYVDGELVAENHQVDVSDVLDAVEGESVVEAESEWMSVNLSEHFGGFAPEEYSDLVELVDQED